MENIEKNSNLKVHESAEELYHEAPCGYISFTNTGIIYNLNATLLNWLGYKREEIIDVVKVQDLFTIGGKIFFETHFFPLIRIQGFANEINFEIRKKDRTTFPALINVKEIKGSTIENNIYLATIFDIADRKKYEQELLKSKQRAEKATRAKADFLATISHEIRTPLNAILGIGNLLSNTSLNARQREYTEILKISSGNLLSLVNNLLDLSKLEAQQMKLEKKSFSIQTLIDSLIHTFELKCKEKGVELSAELDSDIPDYVTGDPIKLNQVLTNLIGNAIKFTSEGYIRLVVHLMEIDSNYIDLEFRVIDTGIGIPKDKLDTIFQEFSQASYDTNLEIGGTGLGLSISQKLLELHDSKISVKSQTGIGSEFSFQIQYKVYDSANAKARQIFEHLDSDDLDSVRVLVVEDNPVNIFIISEYLKEWQIKFDTARNGKKAIEAVKSTKYNVILMDLNMPILNGFDAALEIRNLKLKDQPAILALSATSRENVQSQLDRVGINDFISKPFGPDDLYKVLSHYIKTRPNMPITIRSEEELQDSADLACNNTASSEKSFDLSRFVKMTLNKPEFLRKFVLNTAESFKDYLNDFRIATDQKKPDGIADLIHKSTMSVYYIQSNKIVELLRECQELLENKDCDQADLQIKINKTEEEFKRIIDGLNETDFDVLIPSDNSDHK
ncbi:PAS domain-containing hybrid sensor histidine kinase/response regulator [Christiangramia sabulilitoris]|uniref:histidine kinase n=1 Tax=Christiangramia sabulilitoris TaxID=2583991 RepID=A0A550I6H0_9FLAO|nr:PAS domain-containing hybrid sensor histidine kinase/response regulator [Christiangramia sabulilitoris]TRO66408.1 response regulator [Christiangramia sabulilitoris]